MKEGGIFPLCPSTLSDPQEVFEALHKSPRASIEEEKFPSILQGFSDWSKRKSDIDKLTEKNQI